ncbi:10920_t:CDS:2 [Paraglomus brasilianum]|uniref:Sterol 24-C-methyltransferase n=1 Tax=Paraglomus brasilianum TaxID=144538 RepID=A0A9N8WBB3_9GLOM|nr:10920_t:CDS:2 [Paraglomus brasilianum]
MTPPIATTTEVYAKDLAFSKALHGEQVVDSEIGLFGKIASKDHAAHEAVVKSYTSYWKADDPQAETEDERNARSSEAATLTNTYYNIATDFYEYGWGNCFHFCRFHLGESFYQSIARHEHYLAMYLNVRPDMKVLDIGCGVGGPTREICRFTGAHVTGLNNNDYQIARAKYYAAKAGLEGKTDFIKGSFLEIPFEENSFDRVYAIEATCHSPKLESVYKEAFRVLKPGGLFAFYEWCTTDRYDPTNPEHAKIIRGIEIGDGISQLYSTREALQALKNVGFELEYEDDLAEINDVVPWYYPLTGDFRKSQSIWDFFTFFRLTVVGKMLTRALVGGLEKVGAAPTGSVEVQKLLELAGDSLAKGGETKIFTPMYLLVGRKPLKS